MAKLLSFKPKALLRQFFEGSLAKILDFELRGLYAIRGTSPNLNSCHRIFYHCTRVSYEQGGSSEMLISELLKQLMRGH